MVIYIHQTSAVALFLLKLPPKKKYRIRYRQANILSILVGDYSHKRFPRGRLCTCCVWLPFTRAGVTVWELHQLDALHLSFAFQKKKGLGEGKYCMKRPPFQFPSTTICEGNKLREGGKQLWCWDSRGSTLSCSPLHVLTSWMWATLLPVWRYMEDQASQLWKPQAALQ